MEVKVKDVTGNRGSHTVVGSITRRKYGRRKHGSVFMMDKRDAKNQPGRYTVVQQQVGNKLANFASTPTPLKLISKPTPVPSKLISKSTTPSKLISKSIVPDCKGFGKLGLTSVIIPSMGRPERLLNCIKGLYATTLEHTIECVVVIDKDTESVDILDGWPTTVIFNKERKGAIACWNMGLVASKGEYVVFAADDLSWGDKWLTNSLFRLQNDLDGYGMVGFNDTHYKNGFATHYLASRCFIKHVFGGRIAFSSIFEFYGNDSVANNLAILAGRRYWCEECDVKHEHYIHKERRMDKLDRENNKKAKSDGQAHRRWLSRGAKIEWESLI